jgi:hypothetical protein
MLARSRATLVLLTLVVAAAPSGAQTQPAPLYELPADGTRVDYEWTATPPGGQKSTGVLRISSVGRTRAQGEAYRWVELKKEWKEGDQTKVHARKLLLAEKGVAKGGSFDDAVAAVFDRAGADGPVTKLSPARAHDFLTLGLRGDGVTLRAVGEREKVETKLGTFLTRHLSARGERGGRTLEYHVWLTAEVPFGWAKFEVREAAGKAASQTVFTAVAVKSGEGAKSEVDESKAK